MPQAAGSLAELHSPRAQAVDAAACRAYRDPGGRNHFLSFKSCRAQAIEIRGLETTPTKLRNLSLGSTGYHVLKRDVVLGRVLVVDEQPVGNLERKVTGHPNEPPPVRQSLDKEDQSVHGEVAGNASFC